MSHPGNTGGPASGKTMRDSFFEAILSGLLSNPNSRGKPDMVITVAWAMADLAMQMRDKKIEAPQPPKVILPNG